jgi:hypothetical protein
VWRSIELELKAADDVVADEDGAEDDDIVVSG